MQTFYYYAIIFFNIALMSITPISFTNARPTILQPTTNHNQVLSSEALVVFFLSTCPRCQRMAPLIQHYAMNHGENVYPFSLDGGSLPSFPHALPAVPAIRRAFLGDGIIEAPVLFLVNVKTLNATKILAGKVVNAPMLAQRIQQGHITLQTVQ